MADDLKRLEQDLSQAPREAWPLIGKAMAVTSGHVKDDWNENLGGASNPGSAFKHIGRTVDFDLGVGGASLIRGAGGGTSLEAEIGPNLAKAQGAMAGWFEEGQANIPALHPGEAALRANGADFERGIAVAVDQALKKAGL